MIAHRSRKMSRILGTDGRPMPLPPARLAASYEAAMDNTDNRRLWQYASETSGGTLATRATRWRLAARARFVYRNNCYAQGMLNTLAMDVVGTGPRPEITPASESESANRAANVLEQDFRSWCKETKLVDGLFQAVIQRVMAGEYFAVQEANLGLDHPVKMQLRWYEMEQFHTPGWDGLLDQDKRFPDVDGMSFDAFGNVSEYHRTQHHPQGPFNGWNSDSPIKIPARYVHHFVKLERPDQYRGVSELAPALELFEELRRYSRAVLAAAESAADIAVILKTNTSNFDSGCQPISSDPNAEMTDQGFEQFDLPRRTMMVAPEGWDATTLRAEQPTTSYDQFVRSIIREIARLLCMSTNVALGDSTGLNYSSGRLDHQVYHRKVYFERDMIERVILDRLFWAWYEWRQFSGAKMPQVGRIKAIQWHWDPFTHVDPLKEAQALEIYDRTGHLDPIVYWSEQGRSWEEALTNQAKYQQRRKELGLGQQDQTQTV